MGRNSQEETDANISRMPCKRNASFLQGGACETSRVCLASNPESRPAELVRWSPIFEPTPNERGLDSN